MCEKCCLQCLKNSTRVDKNLSSFSRNPIIHDVTVKKKIYMGNKIINVHYFSPGKNMDLFSAFNSQKAVNH